MSAIEVKGHLRSSVQNGVYPENAFTISVTGTFQLLTAIGGIAVRVWH